MPCAVVCQRDSPPNDNLSSPRLFGERKAAVGVVGLVSMRTPSNFVDHHGQTGVVLGGVSASHPRRDVT